MNIFRRVISAVVCFSMVVAALIVGTGYEITEEKQVADHNSVVIWYTDEALTDYLSACAVSFNEKFGVRVIPQYQSGLDYLENVYNASVHEGVTPDLFIVSNEALEKACLTGVAGVISDPHGIVNTEFFPNASLEAVSYKGDYVGYPFYFETSVLLYNKSYITDMAKNQLLAAGTADGNREETDKDKKEDEVTDEEIAEKTEELLPDTFEELLDFADSYDAPTGVEAVFKWDVSDIFYNYFFVGNYLNMGGPCGDDPDNINIYNMDAIRAMKVYQDMNQFFAFETEDLSYDSVIQEFIDGKLVMTTATSDIIKHLEQAKEDGLFQYEYGLKEIPDLNQHMKTKSMSVTNTVVVNGYSEKKEEANQFASYVIAEEAPYLYEMSGKIPCKSSVSSQEDLVSVFFAEYAQSVPAPKMMVTSNFWVEAEPVFADIWKGKDVSGCIKGLSEMMMEQVTGEKYEEEYIELPKEETSVEYLDEEAEKEAAKSAE